MKKAIFAISVVVLLSGCQSVNPQQLSDAAKALQTACTIRDVGSAAFDAYVAAKPGRIDAKGVAWKKGVMASTQPICDNPGAVVDPGKALTLVVQIGFALSDFIKEIDAAPVP